MTDRNPIAALLGLKPARDKHVLTIAGRGYELYPARDGNAEALYRTDVCSGASSPAFSLRYVAEMNHQAHLGHYLSGKRAKLLLRSIDALDSARTELCRVRKG